ncbi:MAG TPA: GNAT family N-acetyltransferase [Gaiellaceae bacterium]|nr:GNAT family N-acetyltransferase [Gaiellaceae bacterium]
MEVTLRTLGANDVEHVKWALYEAVSWSPDRELPPYETLIDHPELVRYHRGWGRHGDAGVAVEHDREVVGVAFYRLFTEDDRGHGYVDPETPELGIAVAEAYRGAGIGTRLMDELAACARASGIGRLSLSVDVENPARRLYERLGYREISRGGTSVRMVLDLV